VAKASNLLDDLMNAVSDSLATDGTRKMVRDSAQHIFDAPGVKPADHAFAAYIVSNAYAGLDDRTSACTWARKAADLNTTSNAYRALKSSLCGGP
jgi:hypothetical protein